MRNGLFYILFGLLFVIEAGASEFLSATIITNNGVISTDKLKVHDDKIKKGIKVILEVNGVLTTSSIPINMIEEIIFGEVSANRYSKGQFDLKGTIVLKNGKHINFKNLSGGQIFHSRELIYENPDPITGKLSQQSIGYNRIKSIRLNSLNGTLMIDSKGQVYPHDYQFSPYNGEKLIPQ